MARSATFRAPAAPTVITSRSSVKGRPVERERDRAAALRASGSPALGMYRCRPGGGSAQRRDSSADTAAGGSPYGFPRVKSNTFSSPRSALSTAPSSNIFRIHDPWRIASRISGDAGIFPPCCGHRFGDDNAQRYATFLRRRKGGASAVESTRGMA
jgi:hypothetical protein